MKITSIILAVLIAAAAMAQEGVRFQFNQQAFELKQKYAYGQAEESADPAAVAATPMKKHPGKAMLLSAIMPGAGEMYAGSTLKAILFFGLEVGAWAGVAIFQAEGNDKEEQFQAYADAHWSRGRYWTWLESIETWALTGSPTDTFPEYADPDNGIDELFYSPADYNDFEDDNGFTHNLPLTNDQQYYEMIGKYMTQFGPGWDDAWYNGLPPNSLNDQTYIWSEMTKTANSDYYMNLRYKSNQALDKAALYFQVVMLNHVLSALDAGFTVRAKNKKIDTAFQVTPMPYQQETVPMGQVTVNW